MQSSQSNQTTESSFIQQQNTATFYLENISNMSVDEIIMRYQNNTELLYNTLLAKAEEDKVERLSIVSRCVGRSFF